MSQPNDVPSPAKHRISRRGLLKGVVALGAGGALSGCAKYLPTQRSKSRTNNSAALVRSENERQGTRDWLLENTRIDPETKYRCPWIEGYCSRTSVRAGEQISFHVSTNPPSAFTLELYRMGYYGGTG